jgi:hypothetical protein
VLQVLLVLQVLRAQVLLAQVVLAQQVVLPQVLSQVLPVLEQQVVLLQFWHGSGCTREGGHRQCRWFCSCR